MKKFISAVAVAASAFIAAALPMSAGADTSSWNDDNIMPLLDSLGIMQGDGSGNYGLDRYVSRAEMAKIVVNSSSHKDETAVGLSVAPFSDVDGAGWAAPYILNGVTNGYINGYLDGTFHPEDTVNYEEAATMMLRVLDYTDDYFGVSYPYGQVSLARNIDLLDGIVGDYGQPMTRRQIARMVYNALDIYMYNPGSNTTVSTSVSTGGSTAAGSSSSGGASSGGASSGGASSGGASGGDNSSATATTSISINNSGAKKLISVFDAVFVEDIIIIGTPNEDSSLGAGKVRTNAGKLNMYDGFDNNLVGLRGDAVVKDGKDLLCFVPDGTLSYRSYNVDNIIGTDLELDGTMIDIDDSTTVYHKSAAYTYAGIIKKASKGDSFRIYYDTNGAIEHCILVPAASVDINTNALDKYVIYSVLNNAVIGYKDGVMSEISVKDTTICYKETTAYSYINVKNEMEMGDVLKVKYKSDGDVDYVVYEDGNMEGPIKVVSSDTLNRFASDGSTQVMRDGNKSSKASIKSNDIVYYSEDLNMLLAYSTKVTGVYEDASPSRDNPTTVTISGKVYEVEGVDAYNDLSSSGPFSFGDTITVCMGRDGKSVAGVVTASSSATSSQTGYVIDAGRKNFSNNDGTSYSSYYVDIVAADGVQYEYAITSSAANYLSSVVKISFDSAGSKLTSVSSSNAAAAGTVDAANRTIGANRVAADCSILDTASDLVSDDPAYKKVFLQRLDGMNLKSAQIRYYHKNSAGEIDEMILNDATGDIYRYGITLSRNSSTQTYKFDIDGTQYSYVGTSYNGIGAGVPCQVKITATGVKPNSSLKRYSGSVGTLTQSYAEIGGKEYKLSDEVVVYVDNGAMVYNKISLNEAIDGSYTYSAYYDKTESEGGRVRVIIAREK